jgi:transposase
MILTPEDPRQIEISCRADMVRDEPIVVVIGEVVDRLDLRDLYGRYSEGGRPFYDPGMLLKVLFFGYCDGVRTSRNLARHIRYDVRYRYYCGSQRPDFRTINRFRKDNLDLLSGIFSQIVLLCRDAGLVDVGVLALDGTKLRASASGLRGKRQKDSDRLSQGFYEQLSRDIEMDEAEQESESQKESESTEDGGVSKAGVIPSDPDARLMKTSEGGFRLCYNSQVVVDANQVIVAADVSNNADDSVQFKAMVEQSRRILGHDITRLTADGGYYSGNNLKYADSGGMDLYLPVPKKVGRVPDDNFNRDKFVYDQETDSYRCPEGKLLHYKFNRRQRGVKSRIYRGSASICGNCRMKSRCTKKRVRELRISENYRYERQMKAKLSTEEGRIIYGWRKRLVEPVFGNIKFNLSFLRFGLRTLPKVRGEFLLICIAHNLKKLAGHWSRLSPVKASISAIKMVFSLLLAEYMCFRRLLTLNQINFAD